MKLLLIKNDEVVDMSGGVYYGGRPHRVLLGYQGGLLISGI